ncbi:MAG: HupE/UreJ family protein [Terrimonas sp.]|nr:HupE/UreJ family protein [Terrimonas sp.]
MFLLLCLFNSGAFAHEVVLELDKMSGYKAARVYLEMGYKHILPLGFDHILFVLSLFLLSTKLKTVLWQSLTFTIAHSVTLGLAMYGVIRPPSQIVEPLIAISIVYVALENIFSPRLKASRIGVVFLFGLVHGMGFAGALSGLGLPDGSFAVSLVMFNVGVELGQLTVILLAWYLMAKWVGDKSYYRKYLVIPLSTIIAMVAVYWTIERIFL